MTGAAAAAVEAAGGANSSASDPPHTLLPRILDREGEDEGGNVCSAIGDGSGGALSPTEVEAVDTCREEEGDAREASIRAPYDTVGAACRWAQVAYHLRTSVCVIAS